MACLERQGLGLGLSRDFSRTYLLSQTVDSSSAYLIAFNHTHMTSSVQVLTVWYVRLYAAIGYSANNSLFLSAQEPKPRPCSPVPFRRDNDFVYRDTLAEIYTRCAQPTARVVLVGLGGVG